MLAGRGRNSISCSTTCCVASSSRTICPSYSVTCDACRRAAFGRVSGPFGEGIRSLLAGLDAVSIGAGFLRRLLRAWTCNQGLRTFRARRRAEAWRWGRGTRFLCARERACLTAGPVAHMRTYSKRGARAGRLGRCGNGE
jgi:hypothetical protein